MHSNTDPRSALTRPAANSTKWRREKLPRTCLSASEIPCNLRLLVADDSPRCGLLSSINTRPSLTKIPGFSSGNALAFGSYVLFAAGSDAPDGWASRGIAVACVTVSRLLVWARCPDSHSIRTSSFALYSTVFSPRRGCVSSTSLESSRSSFSHLSFSPALQRSPDTSKSRPRITSRTRSSSTTLAGGYTTTPPRCCESSTRTRGPYRLNHLSPLYLR